MSPLARLIDAYDFPSGYLDLLEARVREDGEALSRHRNAAFAQAGEKWLTTLVESKPVMGPKVRVRNGSWAGMTPQERSAEIARRWKVRKANATPDDKPPSTPSPGRKARKSRRAPPTATNVAAHRKAEVYRTPMSAFTPLLDYRPTWFEGRGFDPSAGDGRMISEIIRRGNPGPHHLVDIRSEEWPALARLGDVTIADYLAIERPPEADFLITNPPFSLTDAFIAKARTHVRGPIVILQQSAWATSASRSGRLRDAGLAHVLHLKRRPTWEMDHGAEPPGRFYSFAWFVFLPDHKGPPLMDWLDHPEGGNDHAKLRGTDTVSPR